MTSFLQYALAGLGGGAVVAALALGLVLEFRTSAVINIAHAATGLYIAYAYFEFRESGDLVLPILGLPERVHLLETPTLAISIVVALVLAAVVGVLLYVLIFRALRQASSLARIVASLGLFLYFQEVVRLRFSGAGAGVTQRFPVLPETPVRLLGTAVSANRLLLAGFAIAASIALSVVFSYTRFGHITRAAADTDKGALLIGLRPDRVGALNWALATMLAGAAVVLIEPIAGLDPSTTSLLVVPALAAALVGGLQGFGVAVAAGLGIGVVQSVILGYVVRPDATWIPLWIPKTGLQQLVPIAVILVALAWKGDVLPGRAALAERRARPLPSPRRPILGPALLAGIGSVLIVILDASNRRGLVVSMIAALLALSVVVICGYASQISLLQVTLAGIAGFTVVQLSAKGIPFPIDFLIAALVAGIVGVVAGMSVSRLRGTTYAVATLAIAVALEQVVLASSAISGGAAGRETPRPSLFGIDLGATASGTASIRKPFLFFVLLVLVVAVIVVINLRRSATGLRWLATGANPRAAAACGIDVGRVRLAAAAVASVIAGLSGALTAYSTSTLSPASFMVASSLVLIALTYLAGISSVTGALIAGAIAQSGLVVTLTSSNSSSTNDSLFAISGIALVVSAIFVPDGIAGMTHRFGRRILGRSGRSA